MERIGPIEVAWEQAFSSDRVEIEVGDGTVTDTIPQMFARRSGYLSRQLDRTSKSSDSESLIRMNQTDKVTFKIFKLWSALARPRLTEAYRLPIDLPLAMKLAQLAERFDIPALANEVCDIFRCNLTYKPLRGSEGRPWDLEPGWVSQVYATLRSTTGLVRLIEDAICAVRGPGQRLSQEEEDGWVDIASKYKTFTDAWVRRGGTAKDLTLVIDRDSCHYHDHAAHHRVPSAFVDDDDACPQVGEWYPCWMRSKLIHNPFASALCLQLDDVKADHGINRTAAPSPESEEAIEIVEEAKADDEWDEWAPAKSVPKKRGR